MFVTCSLLTLLWAVSTGPAGTANQCWPYGDTQRCSPKPAQETRTPPGDTPARSSPSVKDGAQPDPDAAPVRDIDDGLPATWEPLEDDDDTMDARAEQLQPVLPA